MHRFRQALFAAGLGGILLSWAGLPPAQAQSQLLDSVKQNPGLAKQLHHAALEVGAFHADAGIQG